MLRDTDTAFGTFARGQLVQVLEPRGPSRVEVLGVSLGSSRIRFVVPVSALELVPDDDE